jgi:hypothetical protein
VAEQQYEDSRHFRADRDRDPLKPRTVGLRALRSSLGCRANPFREIASITTILVEPINLP